jgi:hypothetical protein
LTVEQFVVLYTGRRGEPGASVAGPPGPRGPGFRARGAWALGTDYGPGDAVTDASTVALGINSLYIQRDDTVRAPSSVRPRNNPGRWLEVGPADLAGFTGTIWRVSQINHGFTAIGTPVGYSALADRWVAASAALGEEIAVGVVREVISPNEFIIQTSGEITGLDPAIIRPDGATQFDTGQLYYVSRLRGRLTLTASPPVPGFASNAMILATGPTSGVVLQWQQTPNVVGRRPVGFNEFYYTAAPGQTVFSGPDTQGNTLTYQVSDQNQVFVNGQLRVQAGGYSALTGTSFVLATPAAGGEQVVFRAIAEPLQAIAPATALPADNIGGLFNGVDHTFPLTVGGGNPVALGPAQNALVFLDGTPQQPDVDYLLVPGSGTDTDIEFTAPPAPGTRFWATVGVAVSNLSFIEVNTLLADTATLVSLTFATGTGASLALGTLTVSGVAGFDTTSAQNLAATLATIGTLGYTSASGTTLTVTGTATIANAVVTTGTYDNLTVAGMLNASSVTVNGHADVNSLAVEDAAVFSFAAVTGALNAGSFTAAGAVTAGSVATAGTAEAATLRAAILRGPTAGGNVVAQNFEIDEGVF